MCLGLVGQVVARRGKARQGINRKGMHMVYEYSWSGPQRAVSAEKVFKHLKTLEVNGEVSKQAFVDSARDENSEMHTLFEWDDAIAGEKYRLHQANVIIKSIRVSVSDNGADDAPKVAAYVLPERSEKKSGYMEIHKALEDTRSRDALLRSAKMECEWFVSKYKNLDEAAQIIKAMTDFIRWTA